MRKAKKLATGIAAAMMVSVVCAPVSYAADNAFGIDEMNWTDEDWASIAMTNDDTVDTGAVIRTKADEDSKAAGYLYRGAGVRVIDKGEEWTEVRSGRVEGYVKNEFLAFGDDARGLAAHYGEQGIIANWNDVNVFSDDQADSQVTDQVQNGTPMSMIEDNGHWITVRRGADSAGYVSEDDVTRVLLVDTAVPAEGEDAGDVPAAVKEADAGDAPAAVKEADAGESGENVPRQEQAAASYARYMEILAGGSEDASQESTQDAYTVWEASEDAGTQTASGDDYTVSAASDGGWTEEAPDGGYTETASDGGYTEEASANSYTETASGETWSTQTVSDSPDVQALYDAYIDAQNAAMDCTSEADAQTKADAAIAAWNTYLAACGDTSASSLAGTSAEQATSYTDTSAEQATSYTDTSAEQAASYTDTSAEQTSPDAGTYTEQASYDSTGAETTASADTGAESAASESTDTEPAASSSGSSAYGSYSDLDLLAAIIWCEAGNQPYDGMVAVGQVVMNRVASSSFPNTISEVLNQPGQFTPASSGTLQAAISSGVNATCYSAAQDAMSGAAPVPGYPLYFNTHSGSYQLGAHYFS